MARRLRLQYEGAMYHVINRGNYRRDVFESAGTAKAFETVLDETCQRYGWELFAYVIMRNHYHLAVSTPHANLADGMHWLQSTFVTRFNRLRSERGHLFQGRYHAMLIENATALGRVANYIHLNPVRAKIVPEDQVHTFRWSSLHRFIRGPRQAWFAPGDWLRALGFADTADGWRAYAADLAELARDTERQESLGFSRMSRGWAIGTEGWRRALAEEHSQKALQAGLHGEELRMMKEARWERALAKALSEQGKSGKEVATEGGSAAWKIQIASQLRQSGAACGWIARELNIGSAATLRVYLCRYKAVSM